MRPRASCAAHGAPLPSSAGCRTKFPAFANSSVVRVIAPNALPLSTDEYVCSRSAGSSFVSLPCRTSPVMTAEMSKVRQRVLDMADIGKSRPNITGPKGPAFAQPDGGGGGVAVITKPTTKKKTKRKSDTEHEPSWRVLLHNDDVHTFDYVTGAIVKVVRTVSRKKAHRITMQAHASGVATVTSTWKAQAEEYCKGLQMHGLTSSIAPDSSFTH